MMPPVILYIHDLRGSGVVTNAIALARRLGATRETILVAGYDRGLHRTIDVSPARLVTLSSAIDPALPRLAVASKLRAFCIDSNAGLIVSMGNLGHRTVFVATLAKRIHKVFRISNEVGRAKAGWIKNLRRRNWQRLLLASADRVVLVGRALAERPLFARAMARGKAVYIANGVDLDHARSAARAPSPHPWFDDRAVPVILAIGRIHPQKNLEGLIDALVLARRTRPLRLLIVGTGTAERVAELEARIVTMGITDATFLAGESDNVFAWLARADVFALVSHWEGSSTALLEALAVGVPVIASRQAGDARFVLDDGRFGLLVDADDPPSIAAAILRQVGAPLCPGDRAEDFNLTITHQRYIDALRGL